MKKFPVSLLCGIAVIVATIILYFTILGNVVLEAIHFIALVAIVLAETVTTIYSLLVKGSPRKLAAVGLTALLVPFAVVLSIVYIINFPRGYGAYLGWYFAASIIVHAIALILVVFDSRKTHEDEQLQKAKSNMLYLRKLVKCIMIEDAAKSYEKRLYAIEEKLRFGNDCVIAPDDEELSGLLLELQQNIGEKDFDAEGTLTRIEKMVQRRTITFSRTV